jgi:hypothetical protein
MTTTNGRVTSLGEAWENPEAWESSPEAWENPEAWESSPEVVRPGESGGRYVCELLVSLPVCSA